jgi:hypothetical protein
MATFGKTTAGAGATGSSANRKKVMAAVPTSSGVATSITIRGSLNTAGATTVIKGVIYADAAGAPGALVAVSDEIPVNSTTEQELTGALSGANQFSVIDGTTYHIGWIQQAPSAGNFVISRNDTNVSPSRTNIDSYGDGPSNPFGAATDEAGPVDVYVTYTETADETRRFYLANDAPAYAPGVARGFWSDTSAGLAAPHRLTETPEGAPGSTAKAAATIDDSGWWVLLGQWISAPASAPGTIDGSEYEYAAAWLESNADATFYPTIQVWVTTGDTDVSRGLPINQFNSSFELPTGTPAGLQIPGSDTSNSTVSFQAGDRIVVELGYRASDTAGISYTGTLYYGGESSTDLSGGDTDLSHPGWVDLTMTSGIVFEEPTQTISPTPIPAPDPPAVPVVETGTPQLVEQQTSIPPPPAPPAPMIKHIIRPQPVPDGASVYEPSIETGIRPPLRVDFWALDDDRSILCPLPQPTGWDLSLIPGEDGAVRLEYPADGRNFDVLDQRINRSRDLFIHIRTDGTAANALGALLTARQGDEVSEEGTWTFTGWFLTALLREGWLPYNEDDPGERGETHFSAATAGEILGWVLTATQAAGFCTDLHWSFTDDVDSRGVPWPADHRMSPTFSPGETPHSIAQQLHQWGVVEFEVTTDLEVRLYVPDAVGVDHTKKDPPIVLRAGRDLVESPRRTDVADAATDLLVIGADGVYVTLHDDSARARRGRRIGQVVSEGSLADQASATAYGTVELARRVWGVDEITHQLTFDPNHPTPLIELWPLDWVYSDTGGGFTEANRERITQLTISGRGDHYSGGVVLRDLISARDVSLQDQIDRLRSGATVIGTSTPPESDTVAPAAPQGVVADSIAYPDGLGTTFAEVVVGWSPVILNVDGTACTDLAGYRVEFAYAAAPDAWLLGRDVGSAAATSTSLGEVQAGVAVRVRVFAYDRDGNTSPPSAVVEIVTENDLTPPPVPSTPAVASRLGVLIVTWDGLGSAGETMPLDLDFVEVHVSATSLFTPDATTYYDRISPGGGSMPVTDQPYAETRFVRLVAVDKVRPTPNRSGPSEQASGVAAKVVSDDIFDGAVGHLALASAAVRTINIDTAAVNDAQIGNVSAGKITTGVLSAAMTLSGIIRTALSGRRMEIDGNGWRSYKADGTTLFAELNLGTETMLMTGTYRSGLTGERIHMLPDGTLRIWGSSGTDYGQLINDGGIWSGISRVDGSGRRSRVDFAPDGLHIKYGTISQAGVVTQTRSQADFGLTYTVLNAPVTGIRVWTQFAPNDGTENRFHFVFANANGDINDSTLHYVLRSGSPAILAPGITPLGAGVRFDNDAVSCVNGAGTNYVTCRASAFPIGSSELRKRDIAPARFGAGRTAREVIDHVPVYGFHYDESPPGPRSVPLQRRQKDGSMQIEDVVIDTTQTRPSPRRFSVIAEHLESIAPELVWRDARGDLTIDVADRLGVVWEAVRELSRELHELRGDTEPIVVEGHVQDPSRWLELPEGTQNGDT